MTWGRPLTGIETWQWLFDRACTLNMVFVARLSGRLDVDRLRDALDALGRHYPTLRSHVEDSRPPRFVADAPAIELYREPWATEAGRDAGLREAGAPGPQQTRRPTG